MLFGVCLFTICLYALSAESTSSKTTSTPDDSFDLCDSLPHGRYDNHERAEIKRKLQHDTYYRQTVERELKNGYSFVRIIDNLENK